MNHQLGALAEVYPAGFTGPLRPGDSISSGFDWGGLLSTLVSGVATVGVARYQARAGQAVTGISQPIPSGPAPQQQPAQQSAPSTPVDVGQITNIAVIGGVVILGVWALKSVLSQ